MANIAYDFSLWSKEIKSFEKYKSGYFKRLSSLKFKANKRNMKKVYKEDVANPLDKNKKFYSGMVSFCTTKNTSEQW